MGAASLFLPPLPLLLLPSTPTTQLGGAAQPAATSAPAGYTRRTGATRRAWLGRHMQQRTRLRGSPPPQCCFYRPPSEGAPQPELHPPRPPACPPRLLSLAEVSGRVAAAAATTTAVLRVAFTAFPLLSQRSFRDSSLPALRALGDLPARERTWAQPDRPCVHCRRDPGG